MTLIRKFIHGGAALSLIMLGVGAGTSAAVEAQEWEKREFYDGDVVLEIKRDKMTDELLAAKAFAVTTGQQNLRQPTANFGFFCFPDSSRNMVALEVIGGVSDDNSRRLLLRFDKGDVQKVLWRASSAAGNLYIYSRKRDTIYNTIDRILSARYLNVRDSQTGNTFTFDMSGMHDALGDVPCLSTGR